MLALELTVRSQSPQRPFDDPYIASFRSTHRESSPRPTTSNLRNQYPTPMFTMVTPAAPPAPSKRPKLSLQTSIPPSNRPQSQPSLAVRTGLAVPTSATESPTTRNTRANTFDRPPPTPSSPVQPVVSFPSDSASESTSSSTSTSASAESPPEIPYTLPFGMHSILRNSPLPKRHISATSSRTLKRMFHPIRSVSFQEDTKVVPPPVFDLEELNEESNEGENAESEEEHQRRRDVIQAEDGHSGSRAGRRKKRDWIWRPMDDDVTGLPTSSRITEPPASASPMDVPSPDVSVIEMSDFGTGVQTG